MSYFIRQAEESDIREIVDICTTAKENTYDDPNFFTPSLIKKIVSEGGSFVCCEGQEIAGVGLAEDNGFVFALFVRPEFDNKGIGKKLLSTMLNWIYRKGIGKAFLTTSPGTKADKFYENHGWVKGSMTSEGERVYFYSLSQSPSPLEKLNVEFN